MDDARGAKAVAHEGLLRLIAPHRPQVALALLCCALYLPCVWNRDLWNPDEPRYAEVAREMVARGEYMLPRLNGEVYGEKPPLYFWLGILAGRLPGVPFESGPRLIAVLAALGTLLLTYRLGRRLADAETGWMAALVLATSAMFVSHATAGVIDGTLTFLVVAAITVGLHAREKRSPVLWAAFYAVAGLAIITKGPVGLVIPAGTIFLLSLAEDGPRRAWAPHPAWGVALMIGVVSLWLAPAIARGGREYADVILFKQNLGRAYESWHHKEPLHYFLRVFPASFLPWVLLLPTAIAGVARRFREHRCARVAFTWFAFTFVFFSLISGKKTRYLLPLFPAASLIVAIELRRITAGIRSGLPDLPRWRRALPIALVAILVAGAGVLVAVALPARGDRLLGTLEGLAVDQHEALAGWATLPGSLLTILPGLCVGAIGIAAIRALRRDPKAAVARAMAALILLVGWAQWVATPALNVVKSARPLAEAAQQAAGPAGPIVMYRERWAGVFNFYLRRDAIPSMSGLDQTADYLRATPGAVVLAGAEDLGRLRTAACAIESIACRRIGEETLCAGRVPGAQSR